MSVDVLVLALLLAVGIAGAVAGLRGRRPHRFVGIVALFFGLALALAAEAVWRSQLAPPSIPEAQVVDRPIVVREGESIGPETCRSCHPHHYDTWRSSHHRTMTQVPTEASVVADFDDRVVTFFGRDFRFYKEDDAFLMDMETKGSESRTFELVLSTGAHHQQAFWFATEEGRSLGKLPLIWINAEQRWVPYGSIFMAPPSRPSLGVGVWNRSCIKCHTVGGRPRSDPEAGHDTHVTEFGISCEACHGAAGGHAEAHRNPLHRYAQHFSTQDDSTLVNPADLDHERSAQVCGQCHSVYDFADEAGRASYDEEGFGYRPGDDLRDTRHVYRDRRGEGDPIVEAKLARSPRFFDRRYWSDGMVRVSGREFNGLLETPCFQQGEMSCLSCHEMHAHEGDPRPRSEWANDQLGAGRDENAACTQCHEALGSDERLAEHTHHAPGSTGSSCYNCHMPHTTLGLMKAMRSHTIDSPDVRTEVETGRPNACNLCHLDETRAWTAAYLDAWYEIDPPDLEADDQEVAASIRWLLEGDAGQRAIAGWHYGWAPAQQASGTDWMAASLAELLTDSYDVVRFVGSRSLRALPGFEDFEYDYVGSKVARDVSRFEALARWRARDARPTPRAALLIDAEGDLDEATFDRLRGNREDPIVVLAE